MGRNPIFDQLNSILKKKPLDREYIEEHWVGKYILLRFISSIEADLNIRCQILNLINKLNGVNFSDDKYEEYLYLYNALPKIPNFKTNYIKKQTKDKKESKDDKKIESLSKLLELSKKETKYLVDNNYITIKNYE
jgi:hypothetical protein